MYSKNQIYNLGFNIGHLSYNYLNTNLKGYQGSESDPEVYGSEKTSYTTEFRMYDPRVARWLSTDPVTHHQYSPYNAFDNNPIYFADPSGADSDGHWYGYDGKYIGDDKKNDNNVYVSNNNQGKSAPELRSNYDNMTLKKSIIGQSPSALDTYVYGEKLDINHTDFKYLTGVVYAESSKKNVDVTMEAAGIFSVLENRASYENTSIKQQATVAKGIVGAAESERNKINKADKVGMSLKKQTTIAGVIKAMTSTTDYSGGAYFWDGVDFKSGGGKTERYDPTFYFTSKSHDIWKMGNNILSIEKAKKIGYKSKYQSTAVHGNTIFSKLTKEYRDSRYPDTKKEKRYEKEVGTGWTTE